MEITLGQQYNVGEKPTVILYIYMDRHTGTPEKTVKTKQIQSSTPSHMVVIIYYYMGSKYKATTWYLTAFPNGSNLGSTVQCPGETHRYTYLFFFHLTYSRWTSSLPSCLWSQRIFPSLPGSRLTIFLSRCKFSTLTTRQLTVEFYLLAFPRFPLRKKEHKSYLGKNRTHDFRTSRCAAYLLDHSGDVHLY